MSSNSRTLIGGLIVWLAAVASPAAGQERYPTGPVTIIVPMPAGGADAVARIIAEKLAPKWGQPIVVVNKAGAGTIIGTEAVAKAKPDGHTLGIAISALTINAALHASLPYDTLKDIKAISLLADAAMVGVMHPSVPATTAAELIAYAKTKKPDELVYLSPGIGTLGHISGELFQHAAGIKLLHVPYQDSPRAVNDLIAGQGQLFFGLWQSVEPQVRAGKMKVLGLFTKQRLAEAPEVPTVAETLPGIETTSRLGAIAPAGTPQAIIDKVAVDFAEVVRSEEFARRTRAFGMVPVGSTPAEYDAINRREIATWKDVFARAGVKPQ